MSQADPDRAGGRRQRWVWLLAPALIALSTMVLRWPTGSVADRAGPDLEPVDLMSSGPTFDTLDHLLAAADIVVVATVTDAELGRAVTDPDQPTSGIRTTLFELRVEEVLAGSAPDRLILEHETALLDGTPITVDGVGPPVVGERGLYLLLAGSGEGFPHHALVGSQGRAPLAEGGQQRAADTGRAGPLDGLSIDELTLAISAREP
jgi:hypothetical protein